VFTAELTKADTQGVFAEIAVAINGEILQLLELVGKRTIEYLKSLTDEARPPASGQTATRYAHPGHWADVTGELAASYGWRISNAGDTPVLELYNMSGHAVYLEGHDGYFVLTGITDPDGPLDEIIRRAAAEIAPEWRVI
jgi:hypothetical protein